MPKYMVMQSYSGPEGLEPLPTWSPEDIKAHIAFQYALNAELTEAGELVDAQGLAGPDQAKFVTSDGVGAPVVTDGPFPETKELLAGYRLIDVETLERAVELPARAPPAPGPNGAPIRQPIEVRQALSAPDPEV